VIRVGSQNTADDAADGFALACIRQCRVTSCNAII
jgi:hypothetical protein